MHPSGSNVPQQSLPAGSAEGTAPTVRIEQVDASDRELSTAAGAESNVAHSVAWAAAVPAALLILVAVLNVVRAITVTEDLDQPELWSRSTLVLVLLLVATQLVCLVLVAEHRAMVARADRRPLGRLWALRVGVVLAVAAAVLVAAYGEWTWGVVAAIGAGVEGLALLWLVASQRSSATPQPLQVGAPAASSGSGPRLPTEKEPRLLAIGASGGGIRAAAFVLGGHQAVQDAAAPLRVDDPHHEPHVFAVSGGSYIAAALALRRTFRTDGSRRTTPSEWRWAYCTGSPELERLRRHTRYLFEPTWRTRDGLVSLVMGAVVNLLILGLALRVLAWLAALVAVSVGLLGDDRAGRRDQLLDLAPTWDDWWDWWPVLGLPVLCLLGLALLTLRGWRATAAFDAPTDPAEEQTVHSDALKRLETTARWRTALVFGGLGWLLVVLAIPAAVSGLTHLATENEPTTLSASALSAIGFGTDERCADAFEADLRTAVEDADRLALLSPGTEQEVSAGACGRTVTLVRSADPETLTIVGTDPDTLRGVATDTSLSRQVVGIGALLALVAALLRVGPSPEAAAAATWRSRITRMLLTWLPLLIVLFVSVYLVLVWTYGFLVDMSASHLVWAVGLTVFACVLGSLVDANATSLHGFYRSRLSDAFAVGVDDDETQPGPPPTGRAAELAPGAVYRFSAFRPPDADATDPDPGPRLHIVATLNSRAANEAPSMRGGFPVVFGQSSVEVHREEGRRVKVDTAAYENFAGPGRVSVMASVAISGAAVSPLMGRYAVQMAPYRFLLALFNARVGSWVRNPMHTTTESQVPPQGPRFLWMTAKPGLWQVALEGVGRTSADFRWIYVSDGGHLDNTGLVECVRHCVDRGTGGRVLVLDASNDPVDTWSAVGDAISVVRADLNIDLRRVAYDDQPPWMRRYEGRGLDVVVVKAVRTGPPSEESDETDWWSVLPPNVQSFGLVNADFPRSSTLRQKFGDLEFEAYRGLGYASTRTALVAAGWVDEEV
ncbi:hypothetical protein [Nocardioides sp.]|uniref:hypothetical protein n=1 Tax=Nocardioides sp. TaxID=35761 RepID=UPI002ED685E1